MDAPNCCGIIYVRKLNENKRQNSIHTKNQSQSRTIKLSKYKIFSWIDSFSICDVGKWSTIKCCIELLSWYLRFDLLLQCFDHHLHHNSDAYINWNDTNKKQELTKPCVVEFHPWKSADWVPAQSRNILTFLTVELSKECIAWAGWTSAAN